MKKAFQKKNYFKLIFTVLGCLFLFNISCGLDTYEVFESPYEPDKKPTADSTFAESNFLFYTNESSITYSTITYLGTAVYYKIFNSLEECQKEVNNLITLNSDTDNSAKAASTMIDTYKFKLLKSTENLNDVTIPKKGSSQEVYIRLTDYYDTYPSKITVDGNNLNGSATIVKPLRNTSSNFDVSFNLGRYSSEISGGREIYITGDNGDEDIRNSTTSDVESNIWYVAMFDVGVARDISFSLQYSNIAYLGIVKIDSSVENN